jgi:hypothetical protein
LGKLLGWLLLFGVCALAWTWQVSWSDEVRAARDSLRESPAGLRERERSWGRVVIGRPSGSEPLVEFPAPSPEEEETTRSSARAPFLTPPAPGEVTTDDGENAVRLDPSPAPSPTEFEYVVPRGRVLSKICQDYYGSGRPPIPERVAAHNGLTSPDDLREGQVLRLPAWEVLFPEGRERPAGGSRP